MPHNRGENEQAGSSVRVRTLHPFVGHEWDHIGP
jgi:hypothetical protein